MRKTQSTFSLKDQLFNPEKVGYLASLISDVYADFNTKTFQNDVTTRFPDLELKERIVHITECLKTHLPPTFPRASRILIKALPEPLDPDKTDDDFGDFIFAPFSHYIATCGCTEKHLDRSILALVEITKRFSAEDAIRYFINAFPDETFTYLEKFSNSENYHVRRLASEGSRAKLPWSQKLITDYERPLAILDNLYSDDTRYVTRSVSNHLNDISKLDPELVVATLRRWKKEAKQEKREMDFITRHALRTLVKKGDPAALSLLGFRSNPSVTILSLKSSTPCITIGEAFEFSLELESLKKQRLIIDYIMELPDGREKVFKLKQCELEKAEFTRLTKRHPMKLMTTRSQVVGNHRITLQINGKLYDSISFLLTS